MARRGSLAQSARSVGTLLQGELFLEHSKKFPDAALETMAKLRTELSLMYEKEELKGCSGSSRL